MNTIMAQQTRIISFDVGIKNMAYCIFEINQNGVNILDWQVLNLIEREPTQIAEKCQSKKVGKKKDPTTQECQKPGKYKKESVGTPTQFFCEKHAKETQYIMPKDRFSSSKYKKMNIEELNQQLQKYSLQIQKTKKSAIENLEKHMQENSLLFTEVKTKTANELDLITLGQNMMIALDQNTHIIGITHVIIENQISPIANRMKTVQGMLAQYFIMRVPECRIEFVSSANKLKAFKTKESPFDGSKEASEYKQHKRDGVYYCTKVVQQNENMTSWQDPLYSSKKKDDLADAFLQGLWYIVNKKWVSFDNDSYIVKIIV